MLTATEDARVSKFTADMDSTTASAMRNLFIITKPGENEPASALIQAAHQHERKIGGGFKDYLKPYGLVNSDGSIPQGIKRAIRKAVAHGFLVIKGITDPGLKPDPKLYPSYE